jgi:putative transcriptional regulator
VRPVHDSFVESLQGNLLVAGPGLVDPNFHRSVVLVGEHSDEGALGVVLNRPSPFLVHDTVPPLAWLALPDDVLFLGGPVDPTSPVVLGEFDHQDGPGIRVFASIGFLVGEAELDREGLQRARVFAGYAGWGPGQLERELEEDSWIVEPALPADVFTGDPGALWSVVLRRKGGRFAILSLMPPDPSTN